MPLPDEFGNGQLQSVSCATATSCVAVGQYMDDDGDLLPLIDHYNGTAWTDQSDDLTTGALAAVLTGVSCTAANVCTAVGGQGADPLDLGPLGATWNGSTWTADFLPGPPADNGTSLVGVSCLRAGSCVALGTDGAQTTFADLLSATTWTTQTINTDDQTPTSIGCLTATSCVAVGYEVGAAAEQQFAPVGLALSATTWTEDDPPASTLPTSISTQPLGVSCASGVCLAVGQLGGADVPYSALYIAPAVLG